MSTAKKVSIREAAFRTPTSPHAALCICPALASRLIHTRSTQEIPVWSNKRCLKILFSLDSCQFYIALGASRCRFGIKKCQMATLSAH
ncbi:hypothetical protein Nepgr_006925 [Nepenthes gracilis]|uniref:Uncharacterized protein n=1 Tax=Nepenthes gracilis TaxID=150966 RepID=A0AAD3XHW4_NEPGR|nr:hypothetical protein Nepgr_006925 [Nepenthes gracilis]